MASGMREKFPWLCSRNHYHSIYTNHLANSLLQHMKHSAKIHAREKKMQTSPFPNLWSQLQGIQIVN